MGVGQKSNLIPFWAWCLQPMAVVLLGHKPPNSLITSETLPLVALLRSPAFSGLTRRAFPIKSARRRTPRWGVSRSNWRLRPVVFGGDLDGERRSYLLVCFEVERFLLIKDIKRWKEPLDTSCFDGWTTEQLDFPTSSAWKSTGHLKANISWVLTSLVLGDFHPFWAFWETLTFLGKFDPTDLRFSWRRGTASTLAGGSLGGSL